MKPTDKKLMIKKIAIILLGYSSISLAAELPNSLAEGVLFHVDFEDSLNASTATGSDVPQNPSNNVEFAEGVQGKAAILGGEGGGLIYQSEGNLEMPQGTLYFWIKPLNWDEAERTVIPVFAQGVAHLGYFGVNVSTFSDSPRRLTFFSLFPDRPRLSITGDSDWYDGTWRMIVLTWDNEKVKLYTDRGLVGEAALSTPYQPDETDWKKFSIASKDGVRMLIDELRIWNRPLSEDEIFKLQQLEEPK